MSNSPLVSYTKISPNRNSPRKHSIDTITIHCYVGQVSVERMGRGFANESGQTSCNYGIGSDGRIGMYVEEKDRSWCSSNRDNDHRAITIECASDSTHPYAINDKVYKSLIKLCADICKRNNINGLRWQGDKSLIGQVEKQNMTVHRWFANKSCPGAYIYERLGQIAADVNDLLGLDLAGFDEIYNDDLNINIDDPIQVINPSLSDSTDSVQVINPTYSNTTYSLKEFVKDVQKACGAKVDGIAGTETINKTVTVSSTINRNHAVVKPIQKRLKELGYSEVGTADGIAGPKFTSALKHFQSDNGCVVDGEATAKKKTWRKLLGME